MQVIDLHCDGLMRMAMSKGELSFNNEKDIETSKARLKEGKVKVQAYAIFIPPNIKSDQKFQAALDQVHYFYQEILEKNADMVHIKDWSDIDKLEDDQIGALLTMEGVDAIGNDIEKLHLLHRLGVRCIALTWNNANLAADGAGEERGAGLTTFGKEIVQFNNKNRLFTDVSHLHETGFWDLIEIAKYPIASHSNSRSICDHPRNLTDAQAKALFDKGGMIHVVYYPPFIKQQAERVTLTDLIKHIDHFCSIGGVHKIGLGSDFDGIELYIDGLKHAGNIQVLINELLKYYSEEQVKGFAHQNFLRHRPM